MCGLRLEGTEVAFKRILLFVPSTVQKKSRLDVGTSELNGFLDQGEPARKQRHRDGQDEDLTHIVVASTSTWEIIMQMNHAGGGGFGGGGGGGVEEAMVVGSLAPTMVSECHLPRPLPPLLYPIRTQLAKWLECLNYSCAVPPTAIGNGNAMESTEEPQVVQALTWLEFIVTLNTCECLFLSIH